MIRALKYTAKLKSRSAAEERIAMWHKNRTVGLPPLGRTQAKTAISFAGYDLLVSIVCLGLTLWQVLSNWHDFKGTYLIDRNQLSATQGKITSATMYTGEGRRTTYYHYSIEYEFTFKGRVFRSDEVTFDNNYATSPDFAQKYIDRYKKGAEVTVYFDPEAPSFSVLEPESINDFAAAHLFLFLSLIGFAIFSGIYLKRLMSRHIFKDNERRGGSKKDKNSGNFAFFASPSPSLL